MKKEHEVQTKVLGRELEAVEEKLEWREEDYKKFRKEYGDMGGDDKAYESERVGGKLEIN